MVIARLVIGVVLAGLLSSGALLVVRHRRAAAADRRSAALRAGRRAARRMGAQATRGRRPTIRGTGSGNFDEWGEASWSDGTTPGGTDY